MTNDELDMGKMPSAFPPGLNPIIVSAAYKGGVGKTTVARELAWTLGLPLIDLDWDQGNYTRDWGYRFETRKTVPLLDAIESGRTPRPLQARYRPALVPCHPDFEANQPSADKMAVFLEEWTTIWGTGAVVDTHPGGVPSTFGAVAAAHVIVTPTILEEKPLEALDGMLSELRDHNVLVVPNMIPFTPPERQLRKLKNIVGQYGVPVTPPITRNPEIGRRTRRMAITAQLPTPAAWRTFTTEVHAVRDAVVRHVQRG